MTRARRDHCLRTLTGPSAPTARLVCLPHSGGTAAGYSEWTTGMPSSVELFAVQYPGHGDRFNEPTSNDVRALSAELTSELLRLQAVPTVLFGHSLGALVAYETALTLSSLGRPPHGLLVSSCPPPGTPGQIHTERLSDGELWSLLASLGGIDSAVAHNAELAEALLPVIRADISAHERYQPEDPSPRLTLPVRCYHGNQDPLVQDATLPHWSSVTTGQFSLIAREGHHFHLFQDVQPILDDIVTFVEALLRPDSLTRS